MTPIAGSHDCYKGPGIYQHFKGQFYFVFGLSMECDDSNNQIVVYRPLYVTEDNGIGWAGFIHRKLSVFNQSVQYEGHVVPRFSKIAALP